MCLCVRVRLSKRRAKAGAQSTTNAVLVCKHRDMNEKELEAQVCKHLLDTWSPLLHTLVHAYTQTCMYYVHVCVCV